MEASRAGGLCCRGREVRPAAVQREGRVAGGRGGPPLHAAGRSPGECLEKVRRSAEMEASREGQC